MKRFAILLPALAAAACHHAPSAAGQAAGGSVAAALGAGPAAMTPGHYDMKIVFTALTAPGHADRQDAAGGRARQGVDHRDLPHARGGREAHPAAFTGNSGGTCSTDRLVMAGGALDTATTCKAGPATMVSTLKGSFGADSFQFDVTTAAKGDAGKPMANMSMAGTLEGKRVGACTGKEAN